MPEEERDQLGAQRQWIKENRMLLVLMAALVGSTAFRSGLNPRDGFYRAGPNAGEPVLRVNFPDRYERFITLNGMAFLISLLLVVLVSTERFYRMPERMAVLVLLAVCDLALVVSAFACQYYPSICPLPDMTSIIC